MMADLKTYSSFCHKEIAYGVEVKAAIEGLNRAVKLKQIKQSQSNLVYLIIQSFPDKKQRDNLLSSLALTMFPGLEMKKIDNNQS